MQVVLKNKKYILIFIAILIMFVIFLFFLAPVEAFRVKRIEALKGITVSGYVAALVDSEVNSNVTAKVLKYVVREGVYVKKGQSLAILDTSLISGDLGAAESRIFQSTAHYNDLLSEPLVQEANIAKEKVKISLINIQQAEKQLKRTTYELNDLSSNEQRLKTLYDQGAVSFRDYETVKFQKQQIEQSIEHAKAQIKEEKYALESARQELSLIQSGTKKERLKEALAQVDEQNFLYQSTLGRVKNYIVKSPIEGYIVEVIADEGQTVSPTQPILRIVDMKNLAVKANVEENSIKSVKIGQEVYVIFDAYPKNVFKSKIYKIINNVDNLTGTFVIKAYPPKDSRFPVVDGMSCDVTILLKKVEKALIIPMEFITIENGKYYVFKKEGLSAVKTKVDGEEFSNNRFWVTSGINENDVIVQGVKGRLLHPNETVKISSWYAFSKEQLK